MSKQRTSVFIDVSAKAVAALDSARTSWMFQSTSPRPFDLQHVYSTIEWDVDMASRFARAKLKLDPVKDKGATIHHAFVSQDGVLKHEFTHVRETK